MTEALNYSCLPKTFEVVDIKSGRTFMLKRNSYQMHCSYPKTHPITGERIYLKNWYWEKVTNNKQNNWLIDSYGYQKSKAKCKDFKDVECVKATTDEGIIRDNELREIYNLTDGWAKTDHYWMGLINNKGESVLVQIPYNDRELPYLELCKKYT